MVEVRNKNSLSLNSLCAEKAILLMAKKLPRQITAPGFNCLRCVYQLYILRNGLHYVQELKSPSDFRFEWNNE